MFVVSSIPAIIGHFTLRGRRKLATMAVSLTMASLVLYVICVLGNPALLLYAIVELSLIATFLSEFWVKSGDSLL